MQLGGIKMAVGGTANFKVTDEVKEAVANAAASQYRGVKITIDAKKEELGLGATIPESAGIEAEFQQMQSSVEDGVPCIILVRLEGIDGYEDNQWGLVAWNPSDTPVKLRMLQAASQQNVTKAFASLKFKSYPASDKDEVTWKGFADATRGLTDDERRACMTKEERAAEDIRERQSKEQAAAPKKLAGLVSLKINALDSFKDSLSKFMEASDKAVLGKLEGDKGEDLGGELMNDVTSVSSLKGKLPTSDPVYVILKAHGSILLLSWLPEGASIKPRMKLSTFKSSVAALVKSESGSDILQAEVSYEDWLTDDVGKPSAASAEAAGGGAKKAGGYIPPGAMKMPGM